MAPNNIVREFRDKLNKREIAPSPAAWDRLDAMLTVAEEKKSKKSYTWLYIAAACIGFLLISSIFFRQANGIPETNEVEVVHQDHPSETSDDTIVKIPNINAPVQTEVAESNDQPATQAQQGYVIKKFHVSAPVPNEALVETNVPQKINEPKNNIQIPNTANANVDELLASATALQSKKSSVKVDPNSLLSQVDGEIELSFREKVIKSAGKNFQNVKVALANRNLE